MHQHYRHLTAQEACRALRSSSGGLSEPEARQRLGQYGPNRLEEVAGVPLYRRLLAQFTHLMALLLWVAGALAWLAEMPQLMLAIWCVNLINGAFSFWQEYEAQRATEELKRLLPHKVMVFREQRPRQIDASELVPGDVIGLAEGDRIPADGRLLEQQALRVDQSTLTGEALPVAKTAEAIPPDHLGPLEAANMVFAGSTIVSGTARALVCATGMNSEFGKIARLTQEVGDESSPLEREIRRTTRILTYLAVLVGAVFFVLATALAGMSWQMAVPFTLGMVVAFVPEGLAPTLTLALAMGVRRMARRRALVKRLSSVETLGAASVICTDKTGTLTENQMTVVALWNGLENLAVSGSGYDPTEKLEKAADVEELVLAAVLCNDASLAAPEADQPRWRCLGDPTEGALVTLGFKCGLEVEKVRQNCPRTSVLPFDSRRKRMTTVHALPDGSETAYLKGAPSVVLERCNRALRGDWDVVRIRRQEDVYAAEGLRVLALARRLLQPGHGLSEGELEQDMEFLGLVAMCDPPRAEVPPALEKCHQAGVRVIMITGDHGRTAQAIAQLTGLARGQARVVTGQELDLMSEVELRSALSGEVIFARASPENKLKVVQALQAQGQVVAVTGDGVNDAPALKKADIGVAMGLSGSDVAREAADMVLSDDSFASIVYAIEEGRAVYANIRRFISYIFTSNTPEAVPLIAYALSGGKIPLALTVMQILAIDLGTDMLPALALGAERPEPGVMQSPPRKPGQHLITRNLLLRSLLYLGVAEGLMVMLAFFWQFAELGLTRDWPGQGALYASACTAALGATIAGQIGNVFAHRTDRRSIFEVGPGRNGLLYLGIGVEIALLLALAHLPVLQSVFGTAPLSASTWLLLACFCPVLLVLDEILKFFKRRNPSWTD